MNLSTDRSIVLNAWEGHRQKYARLMRQLFRTSVMQLVLSWCHRPLSINLEQAGFPKVPGDLGIFTLDAHLVIDSGCS